MTQGQEHPLLARLLRRVGATVDTAPSEAAWRELVGLLRRTYVDADQDRYTLERSIDISSREMQGLYQDLKRRSESELAVERAVLRATLESIADGILVVDRQRRVIAANARCLELLGVPAETIATRDHRQVIEAMASHMADPEEMRARIEEIYASTGVTHDEITLLERRLDRYSAPILLPDGVVVGRVTVYRDVTAERHARAQLERAREAAELASQAKSMFLATMSHELRTPLNAVIGLADLLLLEGGDPLTPKQAKYLDGILQSGRHLLEMVNDVLDLAKIEAGKHDLELEHVGTEDAIVEAVSLLQPLANTRGVELAAAVAPHTPPVHADPLRLRQILVNLISNAVKFTDRTGRVRVSADADSRGIAIRVADTGIGISPEDISRLFRAFEQLKLPSGDRPGGTGLGLALTKRLVEMHGGTIDVASTLGSGTVFTVRLPGA